jgi:hypothetical protein
MLGLGTTELIVLFISGFIGLGFVVLVLAAIKYLTSNKANRS